MGCFALNSYTGKFPASRKLFQVGYFVVRTMLSLFATVLPMTTHLLELPSIRWSRAYQVWT